MNTHKSKASVPVRCAIGAVVSLLLMLLSTLVCAWMFLQEHLDITHIPTIRIGMLFLSALAGVFLSVHDLQDGRVMVSIITGSAIILLHIGIAVVFYGNESCRLLINIITVVIAVFIAILAAERSKTPKGKRRKRRKT